MISVDNWKLLLCCTTLENWAFPNTFLKKPGKLSSEEYDFVLLHHHAAVNLLQAFHTDPAVVSMLSMLHHDFDSAGLNVPTPEHRPICRSGHEFWRSPMPLIHSVHPSHIAAG
jgi:hypothetical protein